MEQRALVEARPARGPRPPARRSRAPPAGRHSPARARRGSARRRCAAQIAARWLLPEPSGPTSTTRAPASPASARSAPAPRRSRPGEEILAREALGMVERERKLTRTRRWRAAPCHWPVSGRRRYRAGSRDMRAAQSAPARRSRPRAAPPPAGRRSRTGSRRRTARTSARPDAGRRLSPTSFGDSTLPSRNWPTRKMPSTIEDRRPVRPELRHRDDRPRGPARSSSRHRG